MKKTFIILMILITFLCFQTSYAQKKSVIKTGISNEFVATETFVEVDGNAVKQDWSVLLNDEGRVIKAVINNRSVSELYIDGNKISEPYSAQFTGLTKQIMDRWILQRELEKESSELNLKMNEINAQEQKIIKAGNKINLVKEKLYYIEKNQLVDLSAEKKNLANLRYEISAQRKLLIKKRAELSAEHYQLMEELNKFRLENEIGKMLENIIGDLQKEGIITDLQNVSFKLSNRELIVNGKRQSPELFQRLKTRYVIDSPNEVGFHYRWKLS
jgi:bla regulator protein blaR1